MGTLNEILIGLVAYSPLIAVAVLMVVLVVYRNNTSECDGPFWTMVWIAIGVAVIASVVLYVINHRMLNRIAGNPATDAKSQLLLHPVSNPAFLFVLYAAAFGSVVGALVYYLATDRCDSWFFALMAIAFTLFVITYVMKITNINFVRSLEHHGIIETRPDPILDMTPLLEVAELDPCPSREMSKEILIVEEISLR